MQDEDALREVAKDCVHCGFCLPACPTYQLWGEEMDSPRGRIYLVNQILGRGPAERRRRRALRPLPGLHGLHDRVPLRGAVRPAHRGGPGVDRGGTVRADGAGTPPRAGDDSVAEVRGADARPPSDASVRRCRTCRRPATAGPGPGGPGRDLLAVPLPERLRAATGPLRAAQRTGLDRRLARSRLPGRVSPVLGAALRWRPPGAAAADARPLPGRVPALGGPGGPWWAC